jgi:hypothetical protein
MAYRSAKVWTGSSWESIAVAVPNIHRWAINTVTNTTYSLTLTDAGKVVQLNNSNPMTLTVPADSSVNFEVGQEIVLTQYGSGQVTVAAAVGVTIRSLSGNLKISGQYGEARLIKLASDEWLLSGNLTA